MRERVGILDNTLREGEQVPGVWYSHDEKLALFDALQAAGVNSIDVGVPATSKEDAAFCAECVRRAENCVAGVTVRALEEDIDLAQSLGAPEVFLMFPFSEIHITHKFDTTVDAIKARCARVVAHARSKGLHVTLAAEDASRGSQDLVCELTDFAVRQGIDRLFLCDTVGAVRPSQEDSLLKAVLDLVKGRCELGVHCHNDLGMATANTVAAVEAGADWVSVTVNGLGERAGNAPLHEVVLALSTLLDVGHDVALDKLPGLSAMAEQFSGIFLSPLTPVVGRNAFRHESGIHVDGLLKASRVYEELKPETVGRERELVLGKGTGANYLRALLRERGIDADEATLRVLRERVREVVFSGDKHAAERMGHALDDYYKKNLGFPIERFWDLADEVLHLRKKEEEKAAGKKEEH